MCFPSPPLLSLPFAIVVYVCVCDLPTSNSSCCIWPVNSIIGHLAIIFPFIRHVRISGFFLFFKSSSEHKKNRDDGLEKMLRTRKRRAKQQQHRRRRTTLTTGTTCTDHSTKHRKLFFSFLLLFLSFPFFSIHFHCDWSICNIIDTNEWWPD